MAGATNTLPHCEKRVLTVITKLLRVAASRELTYAPGFR